DILFRFQRILAIQGKACQELNECILQRKPYIHNKRFKQSFENLRLSLVKLRDDQQYDLLWVNALFALYRNLKSIDSQLLNLETEQHIQ
ncbi:FUSC family membrane protein, partial [Acinetobacter pittii]